MTVKTLKPGEPGFLEAIPCWDECVHPTNPDGTVTVRDTQTITSPDSGAVESPGEHKSDPGLNEGTAK